MTTYLYVHYFNGEARYVGIGTASRPFNFWARNRVWRAIRAKYGNPDVQFIGVFETREEACAAEVQAIADLRALGARLANLSSGGDSGGLAAPETRMLMSLAHLSRHRSDDERRAAAERARAAWADPKKRAQMSAALKEALGTPEARAATSIRSAAAMARTGAREVIAQKLADHWADPDKRAASSSAKRELMRTPEKRAQMSALAKAQHAKRAAEGAHITKGPVVRKDTGEVFRCLADAARAARCSPRRMRQHLRTGDGQIDGAQWARVE